MSALLHPFTVIYVQQNDGPFWQFFECMAEDGDHAEEQCVNAEPGASVLWVNAGHGPAARSMDEEGAP